MLGVVFVQRMHCLHVPVCFVAYRSDLVVVLGPVRVAVVEAVAKTAVTADVDAALDAVDFE